MSERSRAEKRLVDKLAYEWKNLYRGFASADPEGTGLISLSDLDEACSRLKIRLTNEDIRQISDLYG